MVYFNTLQGAAPTMYKIESPYLIGAETKYMPFCRRHYQCIVVNENVLILIEMSMKFISEDSINNIPALVQLMVWRRQAIIWTKDG